jgi:hypothetical protein
MSDAGLALHSGNRGPLSAASNRYEPDEAEGIVHDNVFMSRGIQHRVTSIRISGMVENSIVLKGGTETALH